MKALKKQQRKFFYKISRQTIRVYSLNGSESKLLCPSVTQYDWANVITPRPGLFRFWVSFFEQVFRDRQRLP